MVKCVKRLTKLATVEKKMRKGTVIPTEKTASTVPMKGKGIIKKKSLQTALQKNKKSMEIKLQKKSLGVQLQRKRKSVAGSGGTKGNEDNDAVEKLLSEETEERKSKKIQRRGKNVEQLNKKKRMKLTENKESEDDIDTVEVLNAEEVQAKLEPEGNKQAKKKKKTKAETEELDDGADMMKELFLKEEDEGKNKNISNKRKGTDLNKNENTEEPCEKKKKSEEESKADDVKGEDSVSESSSKRCDGQVCFKCGSADHLARKCKQSTKGHSYADCYICHEKGHMFQNCPKYDKKLHKPVKAHIYKYSTHHICYRCGSNNHISKYCDKAVENDYKFAKCYICHMLGHLSRHCPAGTKNAGH